MCRLASVVSYHWLWYKWFRKKQFKVAMLGLDSTGKGTIIYGLIPYAVFTIPAMIAPISYAHAGFHLDAWDSDCRERIRGFWRCYSANAHALIFVVDSSDSERLPQSRADLTRLLQEDARPDSVLLVFANKQDLPGALPPAQVATELGLNSIANRPWHIIGTCGLTGEGILSGLNWLGRNLNAHF
jgi:GTPase SAR1 family protein